MALVSDYVINHAAIEVQYERGVVYLDKCGSLMLAMQTALGAPRGDAPRAVEFRAVATAVTNTTLP